MQADRARIEEHLERSLATVTALNPILGYAAATEVAQQALASGKSVSEVVMERGLLAREELEEVLAPSSLTGARELPAPPNRPDEAGMSHVSTGRLPPAGRVQALVNEAHARFRGDCGGELSRVYPALERASRDWFGICVVSTGGAVYAAGESAQTFPLMSVAKPFVFALVSELLGPAEARRRLGVNSTGLPFNSLEAIERSEDGRTNPW